MNKIPTTVEAQIRTRARNLPIHKCFLNDDWEKTQMANIMITRKHTNGNITMGNYLVDLKLRGVKDCTYKFNESPLRMDEMLERFDWLEECDYNLAHNIIYAGLEFAEDYGFAPHKNFKAAQYILDEDTDEIPVIEIPLGNDGTPVLEVPFGETGQHEITILNKTAGHNYRVVFFDKEGKPSILNRPYMEILNDILDTSINDYMKKCGNHTSDTEIQVLIDLFYIAIGFTEEEKEHIDNVYDSIAKDTRLTMTYTPEYDYEEELKPSLNFFLDGKIEDAIAESRKLISKYPEEPLLWDIFINNLSIDSDLIDEEVMKEAYSLFPDHPSIKAWYAEWLAQENRADEVLALFNHIPGLDALTTDNTFISFNALTSFCFAYAKSWLDKEDVLRAEPYYQLIVRLSLDFRIGLDIQNLVTEMKREKINELNNAKMFDSNEETEI